MNVQNIGANAYAQNFCVGNDKVGKRKTAAKKRLLTCAAVGTAGGVLAYNTLTTSKKAAKYKNATLIGFGLAVFAGLLDKHRRIYEAKQKAAREKDF